MSRAYDHRSFDQTRLGILGSRIYDCWHPPYRENSPWMLVDLVPSTLARPPKALGCTRLIPPHKTMSRISAETYDLMTLEASLPIHD